MGERRLETIGGVTFLVTPDGQRYRYADVMAFNNPGMQYDDATGEPLIAVPERAEDPAVPATPTREEYSFGDVGGQTFRRAIEDVSNIAGSGGEVTRSLLPEDWQQTFPDAMLAAGDYGLAGLTGLLGAVETGAGYAGEVGDAAMRGLHSAVGADYRYAPGDGARALQRDLMGMFEAAGAAPEGRMLGSIAEAARPSVARGVMDFAADESGALKLPGKSFGEGWGDVYHWSRSPDDFSEFDLSKSTGSTSRLGPHVGTQRAAQDRFNGWQEPSGFTVPLKADLSMPFNNPSNSKPWTELDLEMFISAMADEHGIDRRDVPPLMRQRLASEGYTSIPYVNDVEDPGSLSHIMLTDRPEGADAVLRSRFARFDPRLAHLRNLSAGVAAAPFLPGLLQQEDQY